MRKNSLKFHSHWFFLSPSVLLVSFFYFIPVVLVFTIAFTNMDQVFSWRFVGLVNFLRLFTLKDPLIPRIIKNTIIYIFSALPLTIIGALFISLLTMRINRTASLIFKAIFFFPRLMPPVVWGFLWMWSFEGTRYGVFNSILEGFGVSPIHWFIESPMLIVICANGFLGISLAMLIFTSAIASIPKDYTWAAEIDGASFWQTSRFIIIPLLKWPIMTMTAWHLMSFINSYVYIFLITGGGPYHATEVWALYGYNSAFKNYQYGYGSSIMVILVIINLILLVVLLKAFGMRRMIERSRIEV
ncbi:Melibiose/raffinose/stachyose import permease protein MelD [subsurface metagenome]|jgi:inositol-phosphate transport system permease protein